MGKLKKERTQATPGVLSTKEGDALRSVIDALDAEAKCGFGYVKCLGALKIADFNSGTGEVTYKLVYLVDGAWVIKDQAAAKIEIEGYLNT